MQTTFGNFGTCVIKSKNNTSDLRMRYLVNSRFVEGLLNDAVCRQYIVEDGVLIGHLDSMPW